MTHPDQQVPVPQAEAAATASFAALEEAVASVVATTPSTIRLAVACLAGGGHLLVEDHPGLGKTTLAKSLAGALGLEFHRLQCTADLLPEPDEIMEKLFFAQSASNPNIRYLLLTE